MTIELKPEDEKLIEEKLRSGAFRSVEEVIYRALVSLPTPELGFRGGCRNRTSSSFSPSPRSKVLI